MNIQQLKEDLSDLGLKNNLSLATLIYLAALVRGTKNKISVLCNGSAGLGKSHLARTVLSLFSEGSVIPISKMTPAGLLRQENLDMKILFIYERFKVTCPT